MKIAGQKKFGPGDFSVGLWHEALAMLCKAGFSPEMAKKIADFNSGAAEKIVGFFIETANSAMEAVSADLRIVVDYSRPLFEMISAGKYDWVNDDIHDHFQVSGSGKIALVAEILHYRRCISSNDIIKDMEKRGLRPATLPELLAFGEEYPEKQREFPIVALGSLWRNRAGEYDVVCLNDRASKRILGLCFFIGDWKDCYRFLAFRK